jgi:hypothetical protein
MNHFFNYSLHHLYYEFIDSIDLKWCIRHRLTYSVIKKCFVFVFCFVHRLTYSVITYCRKGTLGISETINISNSNSLNWCWRVFVNPCFYFYSFVYIFINSLMVWCVRICKKETLGFLWRGVGFLLGWWEGALFCGGLVGKGVGFF